VVKSKLLNDSANTIRFLSWNTPFESHVLGPHYQVVRQSDTGDVELGYQGIMVKRAPPRETDYVALEPGESLAAQQNLTNSFHFCRDQQYTIRFQGNLLLASSKEIKFSSNAPAFAVGKAFERC